MTTDATLPAAVPLRLPPRSAYATPSSKSSKSTQRLKSSLTYYPIRPFAPLHVCMEDLTADIFQFRDHESIQIGVDTTQRVRLLSRGGLSRAQSSSSAISSLLQPFQVYLSGLRKGLLPRTT